ncbi:MAG: tRNA (adenosine(37)-N6)-threonylcarbamoyltransferase complex dimerization subunit type 1 TsaB [Bacteroidales bacterium]|nr:tRNA (adenosine(37)-N6)-threonylcarbamoyltransferase complex dimerization subunit type 1 TsaB [Bacteroidales bacterium]
MKQTPILLHIETATDVCSVALSRGAEIIGLKEEAGGNNHAKNLLPFVEEALKQGGCTIRDLNGVAVSIGPGSYTGLRIGVSTAKGIAYTAGIPVMAISTLEGIAQGAKASWTKTASEPVQIVPMIDARRMEVFTTRYDFEMNPLEEVTSKIVEKNTFAELLSAQKVLFCGNGMPKCRELLSAFPNACFIDTPISAQNLLPAALKKWQAQDFEDVAYFEPFYLKEYVAAKPVVKGLR